MPVKTLRARSGGRMLRPVFEWQMRRGGGRTRFARVCALVLALSLSFGWPAQCAAYAVLAHEAIIDSVWDTNVRPLLLKRFPDATAEEIKEAHGYAYGGAIIQDMGYYPHGSHFFSDLTHYVRSGDLSWLYCAIPSTLTAMLLPSGRSLTTPRTTTATSWLRIARSPSCIPS